MTIQPIIENAVKYGLEPLREPGVLRVFAEVHDQELHIIISDNGVGIEEGLLRQMQERLEEDARMIGDPYTYKAEEQTSELNSVLASKMTRRGIGLTNVHRRIVLLFGEAYGLRIQSKQEVGTTVIIAMPLPRKGV
ncbi:putative sensor-like histidine kinase [compost metagenome]